MAGNDEVLKVGLVIKEFDAARGGAERYAVGLATSLVALGHEVHVFCHRAGPAPKGVAIHLVPIVTYSKRLSFLSYRSFLAFPEAARRAYGASGLDIVHGLTQIFPQDVHRAGGGVHRVWVRIQRPNPISRFLHELTPRELARRRVESAIYRPGNYAFVMTNSQLVRQHVIAEFGVSPERVVVVTNGVDPATFHPGLRDHRVEVRRELGLGEDERVLLFASSNFARKGLATLIDALAIARERGVDAALLVAGGARSDAFRARARRRRLESRVRFLGHVTAIERLYGAADAFVLPTFYDPFSNACFEAMAAGLPVVTSAANGVSELLRDGVNGRVLADPTDALAIAEAILDLAAPGRAEAMGRLAHETTLPYTPLRHASETVALYRRAIEVRTWNWRA